MTPNLPSLLARLAAAAPGVCRCVSGAAGPHYQIGDYGFWVHHSAGLVAKVKPLDYQITGQPALAWLAGAVQAAIRAEPTIHETALTWQRNRYNGRQDFTLWGENLDGSGWAATEAEALLTAFVEYVEGVGVKE